MYIYICIFSIFYFLFDLKIIANLSNLKILTIQVTYIFSIKVARPKAFNVYVSWTLNLEPVLVFVLQSRHWVHRLSPPQTTSSLHFPMNLALWEAADELGRRWGRVLTYWVSLFGQIHLTLLGTHNIHVCAQTSTQDPAGNLSYTKLITLGASQGGKGKNGWRSIPWAFVNGNK